MRFTARSICAFVFPLLLLVTGTAEAHPDIDIGMTTRRPVEPPPPHTPAHLPLSRAQRLYDLPPSTKLRPDLMTPEMRRRDKQKIDEALKRLADCQDMNKLVGYSGAELADYVANLSDWECANAFFSMPSALAAQLDSPANVDAIADRFVTEAGAYASTNGALLDLALYLRATYYLAAAGTIPEISPTIQAKLRPALMQLITGPVLFTPNNAASSTAGEVLTLITNMHDEANYLDVVKQRVAGFTNSPSTPNAAKNLDDPNIGYGFTGLLKIFFYAHYRPDAVALIENDPSYATTLYTFVRANKAELLNDTAAAYQLNQAATESFRFAMHPALLPTVSGFMKDALSASTMTGDDRLIWLAAAEAVKFYDNANCQAYGTCNFEVPLAAAILSKNYHCASGAVTLRTEELTPAQAESACNRLAQETPYFHAMLHTGNVAVANDHDTTLEVVVFSNNAEYDNYSTVLFGNDTNNGGIYLEGDPSSPTNQARFIAFEADWLRPTFEIWNLKHEYVHYLDGRYEMYGDFNYENQVPVVWYLEGLAEYISRENDDQEAIDAAATGQYRLSDIFKNTYGMDDYVNRAYSWGYMAVRFIFERHSEVLSSILPKFRCGDYAGYWQIMQQLSTQYDDEFVRWVATATTNGTPKPPFHAPMPTAAQATRRARVNAAYAPKGD